MKKLLFVFLGLLLLAGICVVTCPDKQDHYDEIQKVMKDVVFEELNGDAEVDEMAVFGEWLSNSSVKLVLNQSLSVDNYFVCSVGKITFNGAVYPISCGILNHVFLPSKEKIRSQLNMALQNVFE